GDYTTAKNAADALADRIDLLTKLEGILDPWRKLPLHPEIPHPENFYSYREDLVDQDQLAQLTAELDAFTVDEYAAYRSKLDLDPVTVDTAWFDKARPAVAAIAAWQSGNHYAANREFTLAMQSYQRCQSLIADYFQSGDSPLPGDTGGQRLQALLARRRAQTASAEPFWIALGWRRILLSLQELEDNDRKKT